MFFLFQSACQICKDGGLRPRLLERRDEGGENPPKEAGPEQRENKLFSIFIVLSPACDGIPAVNGCR